MQWNGAYAMDLVNFALLLIAIATVALVPIGCIMTRSHAKPPVVTPAIH
jgi:hypothetical protein